MPIEDRFESRGSLLASGNGNGVKRTKRVAEEGTLVVNESHKGR